MVCKIDGGISMELPIRLGIVQLQGVFFHLFYRLGRKPKRFLGLFSIVIWFISPQRSGSDLGDMLHEARG